MRYAIIFAASAILVSAILAGAYKGGYLSGSAADTKLNGVAVVDLDDLAKRLGDDVTIQKQMKDTQASLDQQLQSLQTSLRQQYQRKLEELKSQQTKNDDPLPSAAKQLLAELEQKLNLQLLQAQQTARKKLETYRIGLIQDFRNEVGPVAREIASQHGLGVVITKNDAILLTFDDAHDITIALAAKLRENRSAATSRDASVAARADQPAQNLR